MVLSELQDKLRRELDRLEFNFCNPHLYQDERKALLERHSKVLALYDHLSMPRLYTPESRLVVVADRKSVV